MRNTGADGFSLIELVIVIVIIGILTMVAVPTYRQYVRKSMASEGVALVTSVATAERMYYIDYHSYLSVGSGSNGSSGASLTLGVDSRSNKYFCNYEVIVPSAYGGIIDPAVSYHINCDPNGATNPDGSTNMDPHGILVTGDGDVAHTVIINTTGL